MIFGVFRDSPESAEISILVSRCQGMGELLTACRVFELSRDFDIRCLAMSGVCAGLESKTCEGDVLVASQVWKTGTGKVTAVYKNGSAIEIRNEDIVYKEITPPSWAHDAEDYAKIFPHRYEHLLKPRFPVNQQKPFRFGVKIAPICTVPDVTLDQFVFDRIKSFKRGTIGLEMEGYGLAQAATSLGLKYWILAKGVQDFGKPNLGTSEKTDEYRDFSAFSSAQFIISFLTTHLPAEGTVNTELSKAPGFTPKSSSSSKADSFCNSPPQEDLSFRIQETHQKVSNPNYFKKYGEMPNLIIVHVREAVDKPERSLKFYKSKSGPYHPETSNSLSIRVGFLLDRTTPK